MRALIEVDFDERDTPEAAFHAVLEGLGTVRSVTVDPVLTYVSDDGLMVVTSWLDRAQIAARPSRNGRFGRPTILTRES